MPVTLPDPTVFDADSDKISTSRPELKKMADAIVTIGGEYNAGTLAGGGISEIVGGAGITVTQPDSAGSVTISGGGGLGTLTTYTDTVGNGGNFTPTTAITKININTTNIIPDSASWSYDFNMSNQPVNTVWYLIFDNITTGNVSHTPTVRITTGGYDSAGQQNNEFILYDDAFIIQNANSTMFEIYKFASDDSEFDIIGFVKTTAGNKQRT